MRRLPKETVKWLDSLDDAELIFWLYVNYGSEEPVWEEITKEEYDRDHPRQYGEDEPVTTEMLQDILKQMFNVFQYKREPIGLGLLDRMEGKKPNGYRYYKSNHIENVLIVSAPLADYMAKRGLQCKTRIG